jgi:hypothetical protein
VVKIFVYNFFDHIFGISTTDSIQKASSNVQLWGPLNKAFQKNMHVYKDMQILKEGSWVKNGSIKFFHNFSLIALYETILNQLKKWHVAMINLNWFLKFNIGSYGNFSSWLC